MDRPARLKRLRLWWMFFNTHSKSIPSHCLLTRVNLRAGRWRGGDIMSANPPEGLSPPLLPLEIT